jgi:nicotinamidase-related amidase
LRSAFPASLHRVDGPALLINNIVGTSKAAIAYGLPIVHSTVNVKTGLNKPPIPQLRKVLEGIPTYDRSTINSWA